MHAEAAAGLRRRTGFVVVIFVYDVEGRVVAEYGGGQAQGGGTSYLTHDHLGSTRVVTGQQGEVRGRYDYLPFGEGLSAGRAAQGYGGDNIRQKFTGKERDEETGLDFFGARYYSSVTGRFISCDPAELSEKHLSNPQMWNLYVYVTNDPLALTDPDGRNPQGKPERRVIDVFITVQAREFNLRKRPDRENTKLRMDWQYLQRLAKRNNVTLNLYTADANQVNYERVARSLKTPGRYTVDAGHAVAIPDDKGGVLAKGLYVGNGVMGNFEPNPDGGIYETPKIRAQAFFTLTCGLYDFIPSTEARLSPGSQFFFNDGGEHGETIIDTIEKAAYRLVEALILHKTPEQARDAAQEAINNSKFTKDHDGDTIQKRP